MLKTLFERIWLFVFAHAGLRRLNQYWMNLTQKSLGINNYKSDAISGERFWARQVIRKFKPAVVFDIGAHTGEYARMMRREGFDGQLFLFEPHPRTFARLAENVPRDDKTHLFNLGFSDREGGQLLFDYGDQGGDSGSEHASLFAGVITDMHGSASTGGVEVMLEALDSFCQKKGIDRISLLKIDTEGNEFNILQGATELLKRQQIDLIQFEFGEMNVVSRVFFKDFFDLLNGQFRLYRLLPNGLLPVEVYNARQHEVFIYQNLVGIRRGL